MEKYFTQEQSFWKQNEYRLGPSSQFRPIYERLLPKIRSDSFVFNERQYWQKLSIAEQTLDRIVAALRAYWIDAPADKIWSPIDPHLVVPTKPDGWLETSPVDAVSLHDAAVQYLDETWMQLNMIDWYILNGFVYDALARTSAAIIADKAAIPSDRENILPGTNSFNSAYRKSNGELIKAILGWIVIPMAIFLLYFFGNETLAKWCLLPYTVYMAIYLLKLPEVLYRFRNAKQDSCDLAQKQNRLMQLYQLVSASTFNPSRVKEQIAEDEKCGISFDPTIQIVLERAIERNSSIFST